MKDRWPDFPADAPLPKPKDPPGPLKKKPMLRRRTWVRVHHELLTRDLWGLVAEMAGSERGIVEGFIVRLQAYANTAEPRGSVLGFNVAALAVTWRREKDELARIFAALEHPDVGWIEDDVIVTFWDDNPDEEDPTAAFRSKKSYHRRKLIKTMQAKGAKTPEIIEALDTHGLGYPQVGSLTRENVRLTTRSDQIKKQAGVDNFGTGASGDAAAAEKEDGSGASDDPQADALVWLLSTGIREVTERMPCVATLAETRIQRWRRDLQDDVALMTIIAGVVAAGATGARFHVMVGDGVQRRLFTALNGQQLPLGPTQIAGSAAPPSARPPAAEQESPAEPAEPRRASNG